MRNKLNGLNGFRNELRAKQILDETLQHFVAVYNHGVSSLYKNGALSAELDLREPALYTELGTGEVGNAACAFLLVISIALPVLCFFYPLGKGLALHCGVVVLTFFVSSGPYVISCCVVGGPWQINFFAWLAGALLFIYPLSLRYSVRGVSS